VSDRTGGQTRVGASASNVLIRAGAILGQKRITMVRYAPDGVGNAGGPSGLTGAEAAFVAQASSHFAEQSARMAALEESMAVLLGRTLSIERGLKVVAVMVGGIIGMLAGLMRSTMW
jgi:hypothetical protein